MVRLPRVVAVELDRLFVLPINDEPSAEELHRACDLVEVLLLRRDIAEISTRCRLPAEFKHGNSIVAAALSNLLMQI